MANRIASIADGTVVFVVKAARWLVLPVVLLLFLQWPLRDGLGRWSREANDLGQWLFALYVAVAVTAATRGGRHLAADLFAHRFADRMRRRIAIFGAIFGLFPWAGYMLWTAWTPAWRSLVGLERFQETDDPGYFLIKIALLVAVALMLMQGAVDLLRRRRR